MAIYLRVDETYTYSYDFRGKTSSQVESDWWEVTRGTLSLNADWLYWTSGTWNEVYLQSTTMNDALANAKKITLKLLGSHLISWTSGNSFFTTQWKYPNASKYTWVYYAYGSSNSYQYGGTSKSFTYTQPSSWTCEYIYEVDLESKTATLTFIQWGSGTFTTNISDTDVANIRATNYIRCAVLWSGDTHCVISKIDVVVE